MCSRLREATSIRLDLERGLSDEFRNRRLENDQLKRERETQSYQVRLMVQTFFVLIILKSGALPTEFLVRAESNGIYLSLLLLAATLLQ